MKNKLVLIFMLISVLLFVPKTASAADHLISTDINLSLMTLAVGDTITVQSGSNITISSTNPNTTYDISIICQDNVNLYINNINISPSSGCAISFSGGTNSLNISGTNTLISSASNPGIRVEGTTLLTLSGSGTLNTTGGSHGAGIGGGEDTSAGTITISSGTINATAGQYAAGIGGGEQGNGGKITITDGTITSQGKLGGAGIGGGTIGGSGKINISGGTIIARGSTSGAGIGSGNGLGSQAVDTINIFGNANITAYGGSHSAAIGGGSQSPGGSINIYDNPTIKAYNGYNASGIGAGYYTDCGTITISGGTINAYPLSSAYGAGIGTGRFGLGGTIIIEDGDIYAIGGRYGAAGIGGGEYDGNVSIAISGGYIHSRGYRSAGIGSGEYGNSCPDIHITGGTIFADTSYSSYNDIGAYRTSGTCNIYISGDSALFLQDNLSSTIITTDHYYYNDESFVSQTAYGYTSPNWSGNAYAWLPVIEVTYATGLGGSLHPDDDTTEAVLKNYSPENPPRVIENSGYEFSGWSNGIITSNDLTDFVITAPTTLTAVFAQIQVTDVSIDTSDATLILGDGNAFNNTIQLNTIITPSNAPNQNVTWQIADTSIATISSTGFVEAISKGETTVTVTTEDGNHTATATITVIQLVTDVTLNTYDATLILGDTDTSNDAIQLIASVVPDDATNQNVSWSVADSSIASVNSTGYVTAVKAGTTTVTVTTEDGNHTATTIITVIQLVTDVTLNTYDATLILGDTDTSNDAIQLIASVVPDDTTNQNVSWSVADSSIASVDSTGYVTAVKAGTTTVTVTTEDGNHTATATITVIQLVTDVTLNTYDATLILGDTDTSNDAIQLIASVVPDDTTNQNVSWSVADSSIASVDSTGYVTAVKAGTTTVTVTTEDGNHTAIATITVIQHVTDVSLDKHAVLCIRNETDTLTCNVVPYDAFDRSVEWYCDNPNVVSYTVTEEYIIEFTALSPGTAHIYVTTNDMGYQDYCTITVNNPESDPNAFTANLSCELLDSDGNSIPGYRITLYSNPIWMDTDSAGKVAFEDIAYDYHTLVINDDTGTEIRRYDLIFTEGVYTGYEIHDSDINLRYTDYTQNIHLIFNMDDTDDTKITFTVINKNAFTLTNPKTGDNRTLIERIIDFMFSLFY